MSIADKVLENDVLPALNWSDAFALVQAKTWNQHAQDSDLGNFIVDPRAQMLAALHNWDPGSGVLRQHASGKTFLCQAWPGGLLTTSHGQKAQGYRCHPSIRQPVMCAATLSRLVHSRGLLKT